MGGNQSKTQEKRRRKKELGDEGREKLPAIFSGHKVENQPKRKRTLQVRKTFYTERKALLPAKSIFSGSNETFIPSMVHMSHMMII